MIIYIDTGAKPSVDLDLLDSCRFLKHTHTA